MGIDLELRGRRGISLGGLFGKKPLLLDVALEWLTQNESLFEVNHYNDDSGKLHLHLYLHPIYWVEMTPEGKNGITIWARSNPIGPGYHCFICDVFHRMGKALNLKWTVLEDDTDYFERPDAAHVEEVALGWLQGIARHIVDTHPEKEPHTLINMTLDEGFLFDGILTPMGPRDRAWLERTAADPKSGIDIFPWWERDDSCYFKGAAEALMWSDVRWRKPLNKKESTTLRFVCSALEKAWQKNPGLDYPWREWLEAMDLCGWKNQSCRDEIAAKASRCEGPLIGYRRRDVIFNKTSPWSIRLPGSFGDDSDSADRFILNDETRRVIISAFCTARDFDMDAILAEIEPATIAEKIEFDTDHYKSLALIYKQPDDAQMQSFSWHGNRALMCTYVHPPEYHDWAIDSWHSIKLSSQETDQEKQ